MHVQAAYQAALAQQLVGPPLASGGAGPYGPMGMGYGGPQGALAAQVAAQLAMQQGYYPGPNINAAAAAAAAAAVQNMMGALLLSCCELSGLAGVSGGSDAREDTGAAPAGRGAASLCA